MLIDSTRPRQPKVIKKWLVMGLAIGLATAVVAAIWLFMYDLLTATESRRVGRYIVYGPNWDRLDAGSVPVHYKRWQVGPFRIVQSR